MQCGLWRQLDDSSTRNSQNVTKAGHMFDKKGYFLNDLLFAIQYFKLSRVWFIWIIEGQVLVISTYVCESYLHSPVRVGLVNKQNLYWYTIYSHGAIQYESYHQGHPDPNSIQISVMGHQRSEARALDMLVSNFV